MARKRKEKAQVTSTPSLENTNVEETPRVEAAVTETPVTEDVVVEATPEEPSLEEAPQTEATAEEVVVEEVKEEVKVEEVFVSGNNAPLSARDFKNKLIQKVLKLAPNSFIKTGTVEQWLKVLKNKGTLAVTQYGKVVFLNQISPDKGGKDILNKKYKIREFITDVE